MSGGNKSTDAVNFAIPVAQLTIYISKPDKEEQEFIDAIERDVRWLGFDWGKHLYHASDYFDRLYEWAELLIKAGKAYVDDQTPEQMRINRGTLTEPGKNSPFRERSVD